MGAFCRTSSWLRGLIGVAALGCIGHAAAQSGYPSKPVHVVVAWPAGQTTDLIARVVAQQLSLSLGQPFIVENKAGAGGVIGTEYVKNAKPDGYTLTINSTGPMAINPALYSKLPYDPVKDFAPVGMIVTVPIFLAVNLNVPATNVPEFVRYVAANPGKVAYGSGGSGATAHLAMEMLKSATGMDLPHIPYKGNPAAMNDLIGGQIQAMFDSGPSMLPRYKAGRIKVLGVATTNRTRSEPEIPTIAEQGLPGFEAMTWIALFAPANTPKDVIDTLNHALNRVIFSVSLSDILNSAGAEPVGSTPDELGLFLRKEVAQWGKVVKDAGAKVD